jgi:hypothetical protein
MGPYLCRLGGQMFVTQGEMVSLWRIPTDVVDFRSSQ